MNPLVPGLDRYGIETRAMLDLVAFEVRRLAHPARPDLSVTTSVSPLHQDLLNRFEEDPDHSARFRPPTVSVRVLLLELEHMDELNIDGQGEHLVVAFRNSFSPKTLMHRGFVGARYSRVERALKREYTAVRPYAVMPLDRLAILVGARLAQAVGRHDVAYHLGDRALQFPIEQGWKRFVAPIGVISCQGLRS